MTDAQDVVNAEIVAAVAALRRSAFRSGQMDERGHWKGMRAFPDHEQRADAAEAELMRLLAERKPTT